MCNCRNKKGLTPSSLGLTARSPQPGENGTIVLGSHSECVQPYNGMYRRLSLIVVGYGTEHERLFKRSERNEAIRWARRNKLTLDQVSASQLCDEVVVELLGA